MGLAPDGQEGLGHAGRGRLGAVEGQGRLGAGDGARSDLQMLEVHREGVGQFAVEVIPDAADGAAERPLGMRTP